MIQTFVHVSMHNRDTFRGCYDAGDDWTLEGFGATLPLAVDDLINRSSREQLHELSVDRTYVELTDIVRVDGKMFFSNKYVSCPTYGEENGFAIPPYQTSGSFYESNMTAMERRARYMGQLSSTVIKMFEEHPRILHIKELFKRKARFDALRSRRAQEAADRKTLAQLQAKYG